MILTKGLSEDELIIIFEVAAGVLALVLVISILVCVYCGKKGKGEKGKGYFEFIFIYSLAKSGMFIFEELTSPKGTISNEV